MFVDKTQTKEMFAKCIFKSNWSGFLSSSGSKVLLEESLFLPEKAKDAIFSGSAT